MRAGAFLCGQDPVSGKSFEHRRQWIQDRMELLAGVFGIDVLAFAVMSNHLHVVLRNRPEVVAGWSDEEVARRWWRLFPLRRNDDGSPAEMEEHDLSQLLSRKDTLRARLSDVSWWMRCLAEGIARRANREDECTGRFWEGRFKCQPLLDESAVAACMAYVDLNPVRAGIAATPETSRYTSIYERLKDEPTRTAGEEPSPPSTAKPSGTSPASAARAPNGRAGWRQSDFRRRVRPRRSMGECGAIARSRRMKPWPTGRRSLQAGAADRGQAEACTPT